MDGTTPPPAGSPNYVVNYETNALDLYKFHVDFINPANSTLTGPRAINVAAFTPLCTGYNGTCVPQPNTSNTLDSLADRLMYRLAYRNFGDHESLVVNHSVAVSGSGGVRWYEVQNPGGTPTLAQQGTFAPDSTYRWMGSVAMDHAGDLALGYSQSSSTVYPSIAFAGRIPTDPAGTLEPETQLVSGNGSQTGTLKRWGDYSAMTVDPVDDCTFWYTQEYIQTDGTFNWSTRIANFKFPNCVANQFSITVSDAGSGTVTSSDGHINCGSNCFYNYNNGAQVTLTATPAQGWIFSGWSGGGCSGTGQCQVTMNQNQSVTATFTQGDTLNVGIAGSGTVTSTDGLISCPGTCSNTYSPGSPVTLNASPASGWTFSGWSGACTGTGSCHVTMNQNQSVTATFTFPSGSAYQFVAATPCRVVDTRQTGGPIQGGTSRSFTVPQLGGCGMPTSATAYSLNVTVVPHAPLNYLTIWPTGQQQPFVSTMNSPDGRFKANAAIVPAGTSGAVSVYVTNTSDVILDINGYFAPPSAQTLQFYPLAPCRVVDTRQNANEPPGLGPPSLVAMQVRDLPILSSPCFQGLGRQPKAYSFNATVVPSPGGQPLNYLTLWPSDQQQPFVSTLNNPTATVVANGAIVPAAVANGNIKVFAYNSTDLIIDVNGYFATAGSGGYSFYPVAPCRAYDSRNNQGQPFLHERTIGIFGSPCGPPASAQAYVMNATVVPSGFLNFLTLWPDGQMQPTVSTLNAQDGLVTSNMAIVPNLDGSLDAFASQLTHLILDISGYFAP